MKLVDTSIELAELGKMVGTRLDIVQAGGGNVSIKQDELMYIKSSGCTLSEMQPGSGFSVVEMESLLKLSSGEIKVEEKDFGSFLEGALKGDYKRPSIEAPLHAVLPQRVVVHVHPIAITSLMSSESSEKDLSCLFKEAVFIPYATPGLRLARSFKEAIKSCPDGQVKNLYFLENHGIVLGGSSIEEVFSELEKVLIKTENFLGFDFSEERKKSKLQKIYNSAYESNTSIHILRERKIAQIFKNIGYKYLAVCPDDVVYLGGEIPIVEDLNEELLKNFLSKYGYRPKVMFCNDDFVFFCDSLSKGRMMEEQLISNLLAVEKSKSIKPLQKEEVEFLTSWEVEKYRQNKK